MLRGIVKPHPNEHGPDMFKARIYLMAWGVHVEGHGDTPEQACFYVKRAIQNGMRSPESVEFHGLEGLDTTITYRGSL